jgi:hypothetical protein
VTPDPLSRFTGYPDGYQDPDWDGTVAGFRDVVLPARIAALGESLNSAFGDLLPGGCEFRWARDGEDEPAPAGTEAQEFAAYLRAQILGAYGLKPWHVDPSVPVPWHARLARPFRNAWYRLRPARGEDDP